MHMQLSVKTLHSSRPRRRKTGKQSAWNTRNTNLRTNNAKKTLKRRSRRSMLAQMLKRRLLRRKRKKRMMNRRFTLFYVLHMLISPLSSCIWRIKYKKTFKSMHNPHFLQTRHKLHDITLVEKITLNNHGFYLSGSRPVSVRSVTDSESPQIIESKSFKFPDC